MGKRKSTRLVLAAGKNHAAAILGAKRKQLTASSNGNAHFDEDSFNASYRSLIDVVTSYYETFKDLEFVSPASKEKIKVAYRKYELAVQEGESEGASIIKDEPLDPDVTSWVKKITKPAAKGSLSASKKKLNASTGDRFTVSNMDGSLEITIYREYGKWKEKVENDEDGIYRPARFMGYLTKADIMQWLYDDYGPMHEINGDDDYYDDDDYYEEDEEGEIDIDSSKKKSLRASRQQQHLNPVGPVKTNASLSDGGLVDSLQAIGADALAVQGVLFQLNEEQARGKYVPGTYLAFYDMIDNCYAVTAVTADSCCCEGYSSLEELKNALYGLPDSILEEGLI